MDVSALEVAARGVTQSMRDQDGFELRGLCGEPELYGHTGVHDTLMEFCVRWSDGLDLLTDAEEIGNTLARVAEAYRGTDEDAARSLPADPGVAAVDD